MLLRNRVPLAKYCHNFKERKAMEMKWSDLPNHCECYHFAFSLCQLNIFFIFFVETNRHKTKKEHTITRSKTFPSNIMSMMMMMMITPLSKNPRLVSDWLMNALLNILHRLLFSRALDHQLWPSHKQMWRTNTVWHKMTCQAYWDQTFLL